MGKVIIADWIARISNGTDIYERFNDSMTLDTLAHRSKVSNIQHLHTMRMLCPDLDFDKLDEAGIKRILLAVIKKYSNPVTQTNKKLSLRKWLIASKQEHLINLVKVGNAHSKSKLPEDMITKHELEAMLKSCSHPRDSAIIALLYDAGSRIGELLSMRVRDVEFDDQGAIVTYPEGKTGWRKNRVVFAASYLRVWLDAHEYRDDKDAPLFYSLRGHYKDKTVAFLKRGEPGNKIMTRLTDEAVRRQLKIIASKAGVKRNIHPHLFRHTRATELANHLTEQQLKKQFGWTASSNMAAKYVHLTDRDTERAILKASGVQVEEEENVTREALKCSRCKEINAPLAEYCFKCGYPLSAGAIARMEDERRKEQDELAEMRKQLKEMKMAIGILQVIAVADEGGMTDEIIADEPDEKVRRELRAGKAKRVKIMNTPVTDDSIEEVNKEVGMTSAELDEYKRQLAEDAMEEQNQAPKPSRKQKQVH